MRSVPHLFAIANGVNCIGPHQCFFCGAPCAEEHPAADYVRDSFNDRGLVAQPASPWVCPGCVICLREAADVTIPDGSTRRVAKAAMRAFSWRVCRRNAIACGISQREVLLDWCLREPGNDGCPWAVSLAVSGQKQLLYRGVVNHEPQPPWILTLEGERIAYHPDSLRGRYDLCGRICAASGKPALAEPVSAHLAMSVLGRYRDGELFLEEWERVREEPLTRLAVFLCPGKDAAGERWGADGPNAQL